MLAHPDAVALDQVSGAREPVWVPACVLETEHAIEQHAITGHVAGRAAVVPEWYVDVAVAAKEDELHASLTPGQWETIEGICRSGRQLDLVVGVAGAGKTTALKAVREAYELAGHRVIGTATSGQASRTLGREAGIDSVTLASLLWRLDHDRLAIDARTVVILDEAAMTDDPDLRRLLTATHAADAKVVLVGDDRQLGAIGPGGALRALVERFDGTVWTLTDNIRQHNLTEREALAELRAGDVRVAVEWLAANDRIVCGRDRAETLGAVIDGWLADLDAGRDTIVLAWQRANVERAEPARPRCPPRTPRSVGTGDHRARRAPLPRR